ncbi:hypothetical protein IM711_02505 [Microbacterium esteraromaticum]|uniref:hypothetical protein n=1 Tax=Microbacterium esteraromaticum TaxID=57043 RepID=UPI003C2C99F7
MNSKNTMMRAGCALALGAVLALAGAQAASAAEHEATTSEGVAEVRIAFGAEFAGAAATVLVLDADADPYAPTQGDIAYVAEVVADAEGAASFRAALPAGLDYWLASTPAEGERYVAMLDGSAGGGDGAVTVTARAAMVRVGTARAAMVRVVTVRPTVPTATLTVRMPAAVDRMPVPRATWPRRARPPGCYRWGSCSPEG